jgi:deazaflavin-dependent oxidoreductase (nitroreductase family)
MYSMARAFRATFVNRVGNAMVTTLLRSGVNLGRMALLTVPGRKSGLARTTPVAVIEQAGRRYLASPYGEVDWVRNLRAAGKATLSRGRHSETISTVELTAEEAAPVLKRALASAPSFIRAYFDVTPTSPLEEFVLEAPRHPVFQVEGCPAAPPVGPRGKSYGQAG